MDRGLVIRFALAAALLCATGLLHAQDTLETDPPGRRLQVSVRFDEERVEQRLQVLEGSRAMIRIGDSQPVRERRFIQTPGGVVSQEIMVVQDTRMGFEIVPRLARSGVQVDIAGANGYTRARGPLGEWFELGAVASERGSRRAWIKVEALP